MCEASYGLFFADPEMANFEDLSYIAPYGNQVSLISPAGGSSNPYAAVAGGDPFPRPFPPPSNVSFVPAGEFYAMPLHMHPPNTQQWNLSIQRQVGADLLLTAYYVGNKSTHRWIGISVGSCRVYTRHVDWRGKLRLSDGSAWRERHRLFQHREYGSKARPEPHKPGGRGWHWQHPFQ